MSVRLRIRVLRLRQLSTGRFYEPLDLFEKRVRAEPPPSVRQLPPGPVQLPALGLEAGGGEVMEPARLVVEEPLEGPRRSEELPPVDVAFRSPDRALPPGFAGRPFLVGIRLLRHGDRRA
jgi:hypothetical protein